MEKLKGPFRDIIPMFQKYKKTMGYKYDNINQYYELDNFCYKNGITTLNLKKKIFKILCEKERNITKKKSRYFCLIELNDFMIRIGMKPLYIEKIYIDNSNDFEARVLSLEETTDLFKMIDKKSRNLIYPYCYIYPTLFRLLYSTGLRINEALSLKKSSYNKENNSITVYFGKNKRTRIIPLSDTMNDILLTYFKNTFKEKKEKVFLNISYNSVSKFFKDIVSTLNYHSMRMHDLRWTFANRTLDNLLENGFSEDMALYYLHIYMGHSSIESTEHYLKISKYHYKKYILRNKKLNILPKEGKENA